MLGGAVFKFLNSKGNFFIYGVTRQANFDLENVNIIRMDLASDDYSKLDAIEFDAIVHCSAETDVNRCEENNLLAFESNVKATQALYSNLKFKKFIYISTDSIFDGVTGNYLEDSEPGPLNYYAWSKLEGEKSISENSFDRGGAFILRTNMYGFVEPMKRSLFEWAINELKRHNSVTGFTNVIFNPLYVSQIAEVVWLILTRQISPGVYNVSSDTKLSKYDFLLAIAEKFGYSRDLILPTPIDLQVSGVRRALNTTLDNRKLKNVFPSLNLTIDSGIDLLYKDYEILNEKIV